MDIAAEHVIQMATKINSNTIYAKDRNTNSEINKKQQQNTFYTTL